MFNNIIPLYIQLCFAFSFFLYILPSHPSHSLHQKDIAGSIFRAGKFLEGISILFIQFQFLKRQNRTLFNPRTISNDSYF